MPITNLKWPKSPKIYEINTWPWLRFLSEKYNKPITLDVVPEEVIRKEFNYFDAIWLMGVWERSPQGRKIAIDHPDLQEGYRTALGYFSTDDIVGSPYAVYNYHVDSHLGGKEGLGNFRKKLANYGLRLILDYVSNHVAIDHIWTLEKGDVLVKGSLEDQIKQPYNFFSASGQIYAHGKDPYFPPWTDTVQINAFSQEARKKTINTLLNIAAQCDGVRCDMAMLLTNDVFKRTWGDRVSEPLKEEFWVEVITAVKKKYPDFLFVAEVYWDLERKMQQQGFNYCYDKRLYDRLILDDVESIRTHINADIEYQNKLLIFIENHDEKRATEVFPEKKLKAATSLILTLPGSKLIHEGQMHGYKIQLPIQLGRRESEEENKELFNFYQNLLRITKEKNLDKGEWSLCIIEPIDDDLSYKNLISYIWSINNQKHLIVVNFSDNLAKGHVRIEGINYSSENWIFTDLFANKTYTYKGQDLLTYGLFVKLDAWQVHLFEIKKPDLI